MECTEVDTLPGLPKIVKMPADARTLEALRNQILDGYLSPGTRLTEVQISDEMGISRATVRTALHQLAKEGLVTLVPYTGWTVIKLTQTDVWELYTLRAAIERLAAQLAAGSDDDKVRKGIQGAFDELQHQCLSGDANRIADADFGFHKSIVIAAAHTRLKLQYELIEQQIRVYIRSSDSLIENPSEIIAQHKPILDTILARDVVGAGDVSERHNLDEGKKLTGAILT